MTKHGKKSDLKALASASKSKIPYFKPRATSGTRSLSTAQALRSSKAISPSATSSTSAKQAASFRLDTTALCEPDLMN